MPFLKHVGSRTNLNSRTWGLITVESVSLSPAVDGDLAVEVGQPYLQSSPLIRIHSECVFAEIFDSDLCDCRDQLQLAMTALVQEGNGILFYLRFDGRGAGLSAKVAATSLEIAGYDTYDSRVAIGVEPEGREFGPVANYLISKGVKSLRLLTNNPTKAVALETSGLRVKTIPLLVGDPSAKVRSLYRTKAEKFDHAIPESHR